MTDIAARLLALPEAARRAVLAELSADELGALEYAWPVWARHDQLPPAPLHDELLGNVAWRTWLLLGGRGSGKTRSSAEWVRSEIESGRRRCMAIVGPTMDAVRRIQVEGPSGLMATCPPWNRPTYEPSTRRVSWATGEVCYLFSSEEPDRLRGPNLDGFWADEITSWANAADTWDMLQMATRIPGPKGDAPQGVVSTTPKMQPLLKAILKAPSTVITRAKTSDNAANLDGSTLTYLQNKYGGTTLGRQELDAELLEDLEGALWSRTLLEQSRVTDAPGILRRVVVGLDPAGGSSKRSDETGIIAVGIGADGTATCCATTAGVIRPMGGRAAQRTSTRNCARIGLWQRPISAARWLKQR